MNWYRTVPASSAATIPNITQTNAYRGLERDENGAISDGYSRIGVGSSKAARVCAVGAALFVLSLPARLMTIPGLASPPRTSSGSSRRSARCSRGRVGRGWHRPRLALVTAAGAQEWSVPNAESCWVACAAQAAVAQHHPPLHSSFTDTRALFIFGRPLATAER